MANATTPADIPVAVLKEIIAEVRNTQASRYNMLALSVLYVYDTIITLGQEIELIWMKPMSLLKVLYLLNRYLNLFSSIFNSSVYLYRGTNMKNSMSDHVSRLLAIKSDIFIRCWLDEVSEWNGIVILIIRVWGIYERSRWILIVSAVFGTAAHASSAVIMGISLNYSPIISQPAPGFVVCSITTPSYFAAYWIPVLAFDSTLFALMLWKGWQNLRKDKITMVSGTSGRQLANLLVRDSIMYYLFINAVYAMDAAMWYWADVRCSFQSDTELLMNVDTQPTLIEAAAVYGLYLPSVMAGKLLLNIRDELHNEDAERTDIIELSMFETAAPRSHTGISHQSTASVQADPGLQGQWDEWGKGTTIVW
ncbi:hypothetical protein EW146_g2207 [Bondarzewia mesenterica]|uniref:DUF6533 domain-containing protein n=1 Tax=Bondarzewia mesenterica TaxID=1095465 RepID=A0A4S4M1E7_9AGAM|nr:hypothetical protein EW146_g2207 [Bondarzewia mesenterica]